MTSELSMRALPAVLLGAGFFLWLQRAGYSKRMAAIIALLALGQAGVLLAVVEPGHSLWHVVGVAAIAASAFAFAEHDDARRIILFGGALAMAQIFDPLGGIVTAALLPAIVEVVCGRAEWSTKAVGLYALVLFVPTMTFAVLVYMRGTPDLSLAEFMPLFSRAGLVALLASAAILALSLLPVRLGPCGNRNRRGVLAILVGIVIGAVLGRAREPYALLAVAAPLVVAAFAARPLSDRRDLAVLSSATICLLLSWAALLIAMPQAIAG